MNRPSPDLHTALPAFVGVGHLHGYSLLTRSPSSAVKHDLALKSLRLRLGGIKYDGNQSRDDHRLVGNHLAAGFRTQAP